MPRPSCAQAHHVAIARACLRSMTLRRPSRGRLSRAPRLGLRPSIARRAILLLFEAIRQRVLTVSYADFPTNIALLRATGPRPALPAGVPANPKLRRPGSVRRWQSSGSLPPSSGRVVGLPVVTISLGQRPQVAPDPRRSHARALGGGQPPVNWLKRQTNVAGVRYSESHHHVAVARHDTSRLWHNSRSIFGSCIQRNDMLFYHAHRVAAALGLRTSGARLIAQAINLWQRVRGSPYVAPDRLAHVAGLQALHTAGYSSLGNLMSPQQICDIRTYLAHHPPVDMDNPERIIDQEHVPDGVQMKMQHCLESGKHKERTCRPIHERGVHVNHAPSVSGGTGVEVYILRPRAPPVRAGQPVQAVIDEWKASLHRSLLSLASPRQQQLTHRSANRCGYACGSPLPALRRRRCVAIPASGDISTCNPRHARLAPNAAVSALCSLSPTGRTSLSPRETRCGLGLRSGAPATCAELALG